MAKDPAVLFYTSDFLSTTQGLTLEEKGALITLLCLQHQMGHLSKKSIKVSVGEISGDVLSYFKEDENGLLYSERMEEEKEKRANYTASRRKNGTKGGRPKKEKPYGYSYANHMENENVNVNVNENVNEIKKEKYGDFDNVLLTREEYNALKEKYPEHYERYINDLSYYVKAKGTQYDSHYAVILSWHREREKPPQELSSFDTEDFFEAALLRSSQRIKERSNKKAEISEKA